MSVGHYAACYPDPVRVHCLPDDVWDPFYPFPSIQSEVKADVAFQWKETAEAHFLTARLPGVRKEEVRVEVESGGVLKISGKMKTEIKEERDGVRVQRSCAQEFLRRFPLPENARTAELMAEMKEDGVLTVTVPKWNQVKVVQIV
ncbi:hypothetical protein V2J09_012578 [Rumex salicifolius]